MRFRIMNKETREWDYGLFDDYQFDGTTFGSHTGMVDRLNYDIYEGDYVKMFRFADETSDLYVVEKHFNGMVLQSTDTIDALLIDSTFVADNGVYFDLEVVGHIYGYDEDEDEEEEEEDEEEDGVSTHAPAQGATRLEESLFDEEEEE